MQHSPNLELFQSFVEGTGYLVMSVRADQSIEYANPSWLKTMHFSLDDLKSTGMKDIVFPGYLRMAEEAVSRVLNGQRLQDYVITLKTKDDLPIQVEGSLFPRYSGNRIVSVAGVFRDITNQDTKIEELQHEHARSDYLYDLMSHDVMNINQEILTTFEIALFTPDLPEGLKNLLHESINELERSSNLISNVKKLWRIAKRVPRLYRCNLGEVFLAAKEQVENAFPQRKFVLGDTSHLLEYYVTADEYLIEVFKSVLSNIMKFDSETMVRVELEIEALPQTPFVKLQIKDFGPGMRLEDKSSVLDQLSNERSSSRGLGLNLTLSRHVVENYGGYIRIDDRVVNEPEKGTNFILLLRRYPGKQDSTKFKGDTE
jgi:PAS domain S-box-containing protein